MTVAASRLRSHRFLGMTQSLCPTCYAVVEAKIIERDGRVYFQKFCSEHGERIDFVCSDAAWFDRLEFNVPGREPVKYGVLPDRGCPYDCGLCTRHEQHTCIGIVEITDACNLTCPLCYASSSPGKQHLSLTECQAAIERLVEVEGRPEILQLSGGEPTIHPEFEAVFKFACEQPIDLVMVNTNGIRFAHDRELCELLAVHSERAHVYLQMDGLSENIHVPLRGASLLEQKLKAIERLGEYGINTTLVTTLQAGVNFNEISPLVKFAESRRWITGLSFQPATYVGRWFEPEHLDQRVTFPDVIAEVVRTSNGRYAETDFFPVPCAHPNSHTLCYAYRTSNEVVPITRFVDMQQNFDLLSNGISLTRKQSRKIIEQYLQRAACGPDCDCLQGSEEAGGFLGPKINNDAMKGLPVLSAANRGGEQVSTSSEAHSELSRLAGNFFAGALSDQLAAADMFRITTTSFMDAYNFDLRQLMKSCVHHVLPSGHIIPFDAYNVFYRTGRLPLPNLTGTRKACDTTRTS
ncbi:MAG: radical SAM protein [Planctomycetaceae bacterium]|nr:radical SAM protein [Planctomycetaceae bacterium]MCP4464679.1 radical SAM protein [Planctomycetaceae bacterium]